MRYFKLALAAGASIVVAARLSPAHALPPVYPLDANGPMRQGHVCIAPTQSHFELESFDTGPGYSYFYECAPIWAAGGYHHHQRHAHHARHHQRHHHYKHHYGHHRQVLHSDSPGGAELHGMMLPCAGGGDAYALEQDQPSWQTIAVADAIDAILDTAVG